jgi:hypothetical protein
VRSTAFFDRLALAVSSGQGPPTVELSGRVKGEPAGDAVEIVADDGRRELLFAEVRVGDEFHLPADAPDLPAWPPDRPGHYSPATINVRLLRVGTRLWETTFWTAHRTVSWDAASGQLAVASRSLSLPAMSIDPTASPASIPAGGWSAAALCQHVASQPHYETWDERGLAVIQAVPPAWADDVCPRLAHHPCIVAWSTPAAEWRDLRPALRDEGLFGRPWILSETVSRG